MSLLMDALKVQQQDAVVAAPVPAPANSMGWRIFAVVLLMCLGVLVGILLAERWQQREVSVDITPAVAPLLVEPATPTQILTQILAVPPRRQATVSEEDLLAEDVSEEEWIVSATPDGGAQASENRADPERTVRTFTPDAALPMVDANTDAVMEYRPSAVPELTAAEVPEDLQRKFELALAETADFPLQQQVREHAAPARNVNTLDDLLQRQIPPLRFEAHVYASVPEQRWVKVNGKSLQEGQWITADIQLKEITPNYVLLQTGRQLFSMEALSEWSYRLPTNKPAAN